MAEKFRSFYIDHVLRQQNAHADALASLAASLALPAGAKEKILLHNHDLYCPKFAFEEIRLQKDTFESKRFWRLQQVQNSGIGDSRSSTLSYMASCLATPRRQLPSEERLLDFTTMRLREHYIADRMMESCSSVFHTKRPMRHLGKFTAVCAELTNSDLSSEAEDLATMAEDDL